MNRNGEPQKWLDMSPDTSEHCLKKDSTSAINNMMAQKRLANETCGPRAELLTKDSVFIWKCYYEVSPKDGHCVMAQPWLKAAICFLGQEFSKHAARVGMEALSKPGYTIYQLA